MGQNPIEPSQPSISKPVINMTTRIPRRYKLRFNSDTTLVNFDTNIIADELMVVSVFLPLFPNISSTLESRTITYTIAGTTTSATIPEGYYTSGVDLIAALNTATSGTLTWTYTSGTKMVSVSNDASADTTFTNTNLLQYVLGFADDLTGSDSYDGDTFLNLYPFSSLLVNSDKLQRQTYFMDSTGNQQSTSISIPIDVFDFVSGSTKQFTKVSIDNHLALQPGVTVFPLQISARLQHNSGAVYALPLPSNSYIEVVVQI